MDLINALKMERIKRHFNRFNYYHKKFDTETCIGLNGK